MSPLVDTILASWWPYSVNIRWFIGRRSWKVRVSKELPGRRVEIIRCSASLEKAIMRVNDDVHAEKWRPVNNTHAIWVRKREDVEFWDRMDRRRS